MEKHMFIESTPTNNSISIVRVVFEFYPIKGGSVTHVEELSKAIDSYLRYQIIIAPSFGNECKEFDEKFEVPIIRVDYNKIKKILFIPVTPLINIIYLINVYFKLRKMERPDIIHFHGISNVVFGCVICKLLGIPAIGMIHGSYSSYRRRNKLYESILATLFKPDHAFLLDDGTDIEKFKQSWVNKYTVVYHGIDTNLFKRNEPNELFARRCGVDSSDFIIVSTSRFTPFKNVDLSIKSFKQFIDNYQITNSYLFLIGNGFLKQELMELVKNLQIDKNVIFLGEMPTEDIIEYLSISDVIVATSLQSNLNRSIQEAMSCRKPVVVFDSGGTSNLIRHMENGLVVKSGDINSFAEQLNNLYINPDLRQFLGENARQTIIKERSWDTRIKKELEVYKKIMDNRS